MSFAGKNLKYLRKKNSLTQDQFAQKIGIKRSLVGAYEEGRAEPRLDVLETIGKMYHYSLDELILQDIGLSMGDDYLNRRRRLKLAEKPRNLIQFVPVKAAAGYLSGYGDNEFLDELNTFTLPMVKGDNMRAFEIIGDSMLPTPSGSVIVGERVGALDEVKNDTPCIVVTSREGIVYKRIRKNNRLQSKLTLVSDNPSFQPYQILKSDVLEIWEAKAVVHKIDNTPRWDVNSLANLVANLQDQVTTLTKKID